MNTFTGQRERKQTRTNRTLLHQTTGIAIALLILVGGGNQPCLAQLMNTGTINGTVTDETRAVVPEAVVSIVNVETNTVTRTRSNSQGSFTQVGLSVGRYEVTVSSSGFSAFRETGIYVEPAGTYTVNAVLKPGAVANTITVTGNAVQVQTTTSEISSTVSGEEAEALPLNGRNYQGLGSLMPGVINTSPVAPMGTGGYNTFNSLNINGSGTGGSLYVIDGVWNLSTVEHDQTTIMPNPDSIEEVKVLQNNYGSKYTLMGNGVVIVQTRSGTDAFHGGVWEFLRNTALDATPYNAPAPSVLHWNIYGWNIGGPLYIPHVYNTNKEKTFFYFNQQWVRQTKGGVVYGSTPTALMRGIGNGGNALFPQPAANPQDNSPYLTKTNGGYLKDPAKTGTCSATVHTACFPGNQIPANRIDPNALLLLNALAPVPNVATSGFNNYFNGNPSITKQLNDEIKIDHNLSSSLRLTGEYFFETQQSSDPRAGRMGSPYPTNYDIYNTENQVAQLQLLQVISPSMTNQTSIAVSSYNATHDFGGIHLISQVPGFGQTLPYTGNYLQNYLPHVTFSNGWSQFGASSCCVVPQAVSYNITGSDDWSWSHGSHFVEAGFSMLFGTVRQWNTNSALTNGNFSFNGQFTGNPIADYLLGDTNSFSQSNTAFRKYMKFPIITPYIQDQWKATRRLTITAGLRWLYMPWSTTQRGYSSSFDPARYNPANAPIVSTKGILTPTPAYDPANGMILNGVNGVPLNMTDAHKNYFAPLVGFALDVFGDGKTSFRGGYGITYNKAPEDGCGYGCENYPVTQAVNLINTNFTDPAGGKAAPLTAQNTTGVDLKDYKAASIQMFSLSWQQQFGSDWIASVAGVGDVTKHGPIGPAGPIFPINQPKPVPGSDFDPLINTGNYNNAYFAPYQGYGTIGLYESLFKSNWYALELGLRHRMGHNLYVTGAYTWSHNLDNHGGWQNPYNIQSAYGNSTLNTPHVFTASIIYSLPLFQQASGWKHGLLGGWKYSDMTSIYSGSSLSLGLGTSHNGLATRPNQIAYVTYPKTFTQWFSTGSFAQPDPGFYGNVRNGSIRGPGLINFNMALYKEFAIRERVKIQFRGEYFNVFNHTNPNNPNLSTGAGNFGNITSAKNPREGQVALKVRF